ncbi:hypothetical protein PIB30_069736 [Stylosanthes scabra]|uniref:Uncharacterized protein n=1 Tax=Stylosanthes scabra TaxID=79078 RepID=A0ABU6QNN9_9FABA|nr:hypothetical protein [Stylosanthes scabra]
MSNRFLDHAAIVIAEEKNFVPRNNQTPNPWYLCTVTQVEEVKCILRLLPVWLCTIFPVAIFTQVPSLFVEQGATLDRTFLNIQIPPASMTSVTIIVQLQNKKKQSIETRATNLNAVTKPHTTSSTIYSPITPDHLISLRGDHAGIVYDATASGHHISHHDLAVKSDLNHQNADAMMTKGVGVAEGHPGGSAAGVGGGTGHVFHEPVPQGGVTRPKGGRRVVWSRHWGKLVPQSVVAALVYHSASTIGRGTGYEIGREQWLRHWFTGTPI